jgi:hypothetical protein
MPVPPRYREGMKEDIHIRVSAEVMSRVRAYAGRRGISLAAAATILMLRGLDGEGES